MRKNFLNFFYTVQREDAEITRTVPLRGCECMEYINEVKLNCQTRIQILARINTNLPFTVEIFEPRDSLLQDIIDSLSDSSAISAAEISPT